MDEEWKWIPGYEGVYEVSNLGRIRSYLRQTGHGFIKHESPQRFMLGTKIRMHNKNIYYDKFYIQIKLRWAGREKKRSLHHLILESFIGPRPNGSVARHLNGDSENNKLSNLCWGSQVENLDDQKRHGTIIKGERAHSAKLSSDDIPKIRKLSKQGLSQRKIALLYGVCQTSIGDILLGRTWSHIG